MLLVFISLFIYFVKFKGNLEKIVGLFLSEFSCELDDYFLGYFREDFCFKWED